MSATISKQSFEVQQEDLAHLATAIANIGKQLYQLSDDLPEEVQEQFNEKFCELASVCHCMASLANKHSERAEGWANLAA